MSAAERAASMSPEELIAVVTRGLDADERTARRADAMTVGMDEPLAVIEGDEFTFLAVNPSRVLADVRAKRMRLGLILDGLEGGRLAPPSDDPQIREAFREGVKALSRVMLDVESLSYRDQETP